MKRSLLAATVLTVGLAGCGTTENTQTSSGASSSASSATKAADGPLLPTPDARVGGLVEKMRALNFMVGEWQGRGTSFGPTGQRTEFEQTESVGYRLSGELVLIEGKGTRPDTDPDSPESLVFRALATARYDATTDRYLWWAASRGGVIEVPLEVRPDGFTWGYDSPQFSIRNVATFTADTWSEKSEQSTDGGKTWRPQVELELRRTS